MTCRPDTVFRQAFTASLLVAALALSGCKQDEAPTDPVELAKARLASGDALAAEIALQAALKNGVPNADVAAYLGEAELAQGKLSEAREWLGPQDFSPKTREHGFHMLGRLEMASSNLQAAGVAFDHALAENPDEPELWVDIGRLRYSGGEQIQALEAAEHAVELGPRDPLALQFRGQLVRDAYGLQAALPWFEAALDIAPDNPGALADYAATLGELGRAEELLLAVRKLAKVDPANPQVHFLQAVLAARAGKSVLARSLLQRSGNLERKVPAAMLLSALIDLENGNHGSAAQTLVELAERQPDNRRVQVLLARALLLGRSEQELVHRFAEPAKRPDASPYLMVLVARAHEALGDREAAALYLDRAAQRRPGSLVPIIDDGLTERAAALQEMRSLIAEGRNDEAARRAEAFSLRYGGSADALSLAGDAQMARKDFETALERYRASAAVRLSWPLARRMIATYRASGQTDRADAILAAQVSSDPGNAEAAGLFGKLFAERKSWNQAALLLDHAIAMGAGRDPQILELRSKVAASLGDKDGAAKFAQRAHYIQPGRALVVKAHSTAKR